MTANNEQPMHQRETPDVAPVPVSGLKARTAGVHAPELPISPPTGQPVPGKPRAGRPSGGARRRARSSRPGTPIDPIPSAPGTQKSIAPEFASVPLEADGFLRSLVRNIFGAIDELVGPSEAAAFASLIGRQIGKDMDAAYRRALQLPSLSREQLAMVLVDLKRRIDGDFYVVSQNDDEIVMASRRCPFGAQVLGRPELCTMTSTMFSRIAADNLGYARVAVERAIARGDPECRVVIRLRPPEAADRRRSPDGADGER